ncbi:cation:proton antiporter [Candidatus Woesearchaeota archaeon]|nr:cation:proton antiporter [Candidatus Woesearchaeota archaeon]
MVGVDGGLFLELGLIVIVAALAAFILRLLKQPQLLAYVLVGVFITPIFGIIVDTTLIESMSLVGIAFLLFIVGLEMDLKSLKSVLLVSTLGSVIQTAILFVTGYLVALLLGFLSMEATYIGLMLVFSSTMVVMKLLSDRKELATLHGRIAIGTLLTQDIIAIFALSIMTSINGVNTALLGIAFIKFLILFGIAYLASRFLFPEMFKFAAKNQELLLILSLAVCFTFSLSFSYIGFPVAIGAFLAGISLGNLEYHVEIIAKAKSLKDFFALLFFVSLGMGLSVGVIQKMWFPLIIILILIMFVKPLVIMTVISLFKYTKKPSFLTANSLAQVGEFSLILAAQGLLLKHITQDLFSLIVITVLFTITTTSYYVEYNQFFFKLLQKPLSIFDRFTTQGLEYLPSEIKPKIVLCGHDRVGYSILQSLHKKKDKVLVIDYNPEVINEVVTQGYHSIYGDVTDDEILDKMNLKELSMFISTIPHVKDNLHLLRKLREVNKHAKVIMTANDIDESFKLYDSGADYVVLPHFLGGEHVSNLIDRIHKKTVDLKEHREKHIRHLHHRKKMGHAHPSNS